MGLKKEKEKIKRALEWVDDVRIIFGMKGYIEQYDPNDKMAENYIPQKPKRIYIEKEKVKILEAVNASDDKGMLGGLKWFILLYDSKDTYSDLRDAPIANWELSMPFGRKLTRKQFKEMLDGRADDDGEMYTIEQVKERLKEHRKERKKFWDEI